MTETATAPAAPKAGKAKKATTKAKKAPVPTHPSYKIMVNAAVKSLKERTGSSRQAILKYIVANYKVGDEKKAGTRLRLALNKMIKSGDLKQMKGSGASGSFRLGGDVPPPTVKKPAAPKKKMAKSTKKPTTPKKPAVKKATKAKKSPAKKPAPEKKAPAKKTVKKTAAKKAKK